MSHCLPGVLPPGRVSLPFLRWSCALLSAFTSEMRQGTLCYLVMTEHETGSQWEDGTQVKFQADSKFPALQARWYWHR